MTSSYLPEWALRSSYAVLGRPVMRARIALLLMVTTPAVYSQAIFAQTTDPRHLSFKSITLEDAVAFGLEHNLDLHVAQIGLQSAKSEARSIRSETRIQLSATTFLSVSSEPGSLLLAGQPSSPTVMQVPQKLFGDQNITAMAPIYTGGRLQSAVAAADLRTRAAAEDIRTARLEAALHIREAGYRVEVFAAVEEAAAARLASTVEMLKTTRALFDAGKGLQSAVLRVEAEMADARRMRANAQNLRLQAYLDLKLSMGLAGNSEIELNEPLKYTPVQMDLDRLIHTAMHSRPEVTGATLKLTASKQLIASTRASAGPQVYGMAMTDGFTSGPTSSRTGYTVGIVMSVPLLDGGQRRAESEQARSNSERANVDLQKVSLQVENDVRSAWLNLQTASQNVEATSQSVAAAQASYDTTLLRVQNQKALLVEQLDSLAALVQARANASQSLYDHNNATAMLMRAVGVEHVDQLIQGGTR